MTTETPTPCRPPDTLYALWSNLPPAWSLVSTTSVAETPFVGMDVDGDAAAVVVDGDGAVDVDDDLYLVAEAGQRLVDGVVDDLEHQVVQPAFRGVADVHARPLADGIEPFEHFDFVSAIIDIFLHETPPSDRNTHTEKSGFVCSVEASRARPIGKGHVILLS